MTTIYHQSSLRKGRYSEPGRIYHLTFCTHKKQPLFAQFASGREVVHALQTSQTKGFSHSLAWVVMPDHVHWLMQLERDQLERVVARVKAEVARKLQASTVIWQKGFHDHALRADEDIKIVARYIVANPLRAGLATNVGNYPLWDAIWL